MDFSLQKYKKPTDQQNYRTFSRKTSQTPDLNSQSHNTNNNYYFVQKYKQNPDKYRSQSHSSQNESESEKQKHIKTTQSFHQSHNKSVHTNTQSNHNSNYHNNSNNNQQINIKIPPPNAKKINNFITSEQQQQQQSSSQQQNLKYNFHIEIPHNKIPAAKQQKNQQIENQKTLQQQFQQLQLQQQQNSLKKILKASNHHNSVNQSEQIDYKIDNLKQLYKQKSNNKVSKTVNNNNHKTNDTKNLTHYNNLSKTQQENIKNDLSSNKISVEITNKTTNTQSTIQQNKNANNPKQLLDPRDENNLLKGNNNQPQDYLQNKNSIEVDNLYKLLETVSTRDNTRDGANRKYQNGKKTTTPQQNQNPSKKQSRSRDEHNLSQQENIIQRNKNSISNQKNKILHPSSYLGKFNQNQKGQTPLDRKLSQQLQSKSKSKNSKKSNNTNNNFHQLKKQFATIDVLSQSMFEKENFHQRSQSQDKINMSQQEISTIHKQPLQLDISFRTKQGVLASNPNKTNQDTYIIEQNFTNKIDQHFFAVCDGHGSLGHHVSGFVKETLPAYLEQDSNLAVNPIETLFNAIGFVNYQLGQSEIDCNFSGTTLISVLIQGDKLYTANVGDSRAIFGNFKNNTWQSRELSRDHKPCLPDEAERIVACGGRIDTFRDQQGNQLGPYRVWLKNENIPGLAMSRSIGDDLATSVGVTWEPEIFEFEITQNDKFLIVASDGVWEFIESDECVEMICQFYEKNDLEGACNQILKESYARWTVEDDSVIDDITLIIVFFKH